MKEIKIVISGLSNETKENGQPYGLMARAVVEHFLKDSRFKVLESALGGNEIRLDSFALIGILGPEARKLKFGNMEVGGQPFKIFPPECHELILKKLKEKEGPFIVVDFTHPTAVNMNADLYCRLGIPFVMGTTGGDRLALEETVQASKISAVIAPNMAMPIVAIQIAMEYMANRFPGLFRDFTLAITESHQAGKADTSGTAKAMVSYFKALGISSFSLDEIQKIRDRDEQKKMGVPEEHLGGHGWHKYELLSPDGTVLLKFVHNVDGRNVYCEGTADAVSFLAQRLSEGSKGKRGKVYSMLDVLRGLTAIGL